MSNYIELGIFLSLLDQKVHTASSLAEQFEVSTKTVYRLTNKLCSAGLPVGTIAGKNGGLFLASKFAWDTWFFSEQELAFMLGLVNSNLNIKPKVASIISAKLAHHMDNQKLQLAQQNSNKLFIDNLGWFNTANTSYAKAEQLMDACNNNLQVNFNYTGSTRNVQPYCIVFKQGDYYLYGYCLTRQDFRMFRLNRITDLNITEQRFLPMQINLTERPWNNTSFKHIQLTLAATPEVMQDISCWAKLEKSDNGYAKITAIDNLGLTHKLMQYGDKIKIISPAKIASEIKNECLKIAQLY